MIRLTTLIKEEEKKPNQEFIDFAEARYNGAKDITEKAEKKGGPSLLTYHHFRVKLPHYEQAKAGMFVPLQSQAKLKELLQEICLLSGGVKIGQERFQMIVGEMEVIGELLIKWKECTEPYNTIKTK